IVSQKGGGFAVAFFGARGDKAFDAWSSKPMPRARAVELKLRIERRRRYAINARTEATGQVDRICSRCGREFWAEAVIAPVRAMGRCVREACRPTSAVFALGLEPTVGQLAARDWLARKWVPIAMQDSAPAASAAIGAEQAAAA